MMRRYRSQRGMTLMIAMVMLVVITLFVVSMIRLSSTNTAIIGNMQAQKAVEAEAEQAVEIALGSYAFFDDVIKNQNSWAANQSTLAYSALWAAYKPAGAGATAPATQSGTITLYRPQCLYFETARGYSALSGVAPQDTFWDVRVDAADAFTSSTIETHQGIRMRLPAGNCP